MKVWLNNRLWDDREACVSVFDHGFLYGDGIYETVRAYDYKVFHWADHYKRLRSSAKRIRLRCPWSSSFLLKAVIQVLKANRQPTASVRITLSRGPGPLGLDPDLCPRPTLVLLLHPQRDLTALWRRGVSMGIVSVRRNPRESLDPQIKSNNSLNTILAKMEAKQMGVFEAVLLNIRGYLTEGTTSNIFFVKKRELYTPSLDCGLLEGVTRAVIMTLAQSHHIKVHEGHYRTEDLYRAEECFLSSTTLEVAPVVKVVFHKGSSFESRTLSSAKPGPVTKYLHALFRDDIRRELKL